MDIRNQRTIGGIQSTINDPSHLRPVRPTLLFRNRLTRQSTTRDTHRLIRGMLGLRRRLRPSLAVAGDLAGHRGIPMHPRNQPRTGTIILRLHPQPNPRGSSWVRRASSVTTNTTILLRGRNPAPNDT